MGEKEIPFCDGKRWVAGGQASAEVVHPSLNHTFDRVT